MAVVTVHAVVFVGRWAVSHWVVKWSAQTLMLFFVVEFGRRRDSRFEIRRWATEMEVEGCRIKARVW
jgi:hypothetical protein